LSASETFFLPSLNHRTIHKGIVLSCYEKITCPKCGGNNLQVFEKDGEFSGFCFGVNRKTGKNCRTYYADPYKGASKPAVNARVARSEEEVGEDLNYINALPGASLPHRKLSSSALAHFGVKMELSEEDGVTPTITFWPYYKGNDLVAYKAKHISPKRMWAMGSFTDVDMFGWRQALDSGSSKLIICTGEEDAVATYQAMVDSQRGGKWESLQPAVVSLNSGDSSVRRCLTKVLPTIKSHFKEVIFCFDQDDSGQAAVKEGLQIVPTARAVQLPCKDANACVIEGRNKALVDAVLWKSSTPKNSRIINASSLYISARKQAEYGLSWPWKEITRLTRGLRWGETIYIGAGVKMGKSEVVNSLIKHLTIDHDLPVLAAKPEEANNKTVKLVLGKCVGKVFHDPNIEFDYEAYDRAAGMLGNKLNLINLYQHLGWDSLKDDIRAAASEGCKAVFIDPISNLVGQMSSGETDTHLREISQELSAMMMDLKMIAFIFCHLKAPLSGPPHERGAEIYSSMFTGSRSMMRSSNYMMALSGNKDPSLPLEERNIRKLTILEDREYGEVGSVNLYWDHNTGLFNELENYNGL
jgi:twinkle protein